MAYNGDPTATQAPSGPPQADGSPAVNVVVDGTACNSASIMQQLKALADGVAWAEAPRALAAAGAALSNWAKPVLYFRTALGHRRFALDHQGFPGGQIIQWDENWDDPTNQVPDVLSSSSGSFGTRWRYNLINTSGLASLFGQAAATAAAGSNPYPSSRLYMEMPTVGGPTVTAALVQRSIAPIVMEAGGATAISMHWDHMSTILGLNNSGGAQVAMGMAVPGVGGSTATFGVTAGLNPVGVGFVGGTQVGSTNPNNWRAYVNNNGTPQLFDTGVDSNTAIVRRRFRIDLIGGAVSDDATARILFWIDGSLVKSAAVDITNAGSGVVLSPFFRMWGEGNAAGSNFGPVRFRANLWPGDVFL